MRARFTGVVLGTLVLGSTVLATGANADQNESGGPVATIALQARIAAGGSHTCAINKNAKVYCWGNNSFHQLGFIALSQNKPKLVPTQLPALTAVTAGEQHTCVLDRFGSVWCWGRDDFGQLGRGALSTTKCAGLPCSAVPTRLTSLPPIAEIAAGGFHTCALSRGHVLYCWGLNAYGELGQREAVPPSLTNPLCPSTYGSFACYDSPKTVALPAGVTPISVTAGGYHTCILDTMHRVWCWGLDFAGELGSLAASGGIFPPSGTSAPYLMCNGAATYLCTTTPQAATFPAGSKVLSITAGLYFTCAMVAAPPRVLCWGSNADGQLGDGSLGGATCSEANFRCQALPTAVAGLSGTNYVALAAGDFHVCVLKASGWIFCWGLNADGELGNFSQGSRDAPYPVKGYGNLAVTAGGAHTCSIVSRQMKCWGEGVSGQLGNGANLDKVLQAIVSPLAM